MFHLYKHFPVLSSFMTYHQVCNQINTAVATSGTGTVLSSGAPEFFPGFQWGSCYSILRLQFYVQCFVDRCLSCCPFSFGHCVVCLLASVLSVLLLLAIVLSGFLRFKDSDYPFGIYKHFLTRVVGRDSLTVLDQKNIVSDSS